MPGELAAVTVGSRWQTASEPSPAATSTGRSSPGSSCSTARELRSRGPSSGSGGSRRSTRRRCTSAWPRGSMASTARRSTVPWSAGRWSREHWCVRRSTSSPRATTGHWRSRCGAADASGGCGPARARMKTRWWPRPGGCVRGSPAARSTGPSSPTWSAGLWRGASPCGWSYERGRI